MFGWADPYVWVAGSERATLADTILHTAPRTSKSTMLTWLYPRDRVIPLTKFFLISETGTIRYQIINVVERIGHRDLNGDKRTGSLENVIVATLPTLPYATAGNQPSLHTRAWFCA